MHPQVFDNTPAALDGTVAAGDEITGVNGRSIKGKTKVEVAKMIQEVKVRAAAEQQRQPHMLLRPPGCQRPHQAYKGVSALTAPFLGTCRVRVTLQPPSSIPHSFNK